MSDLKQDLTLLLHTVLAAVKHRGPGGLYRVYVQGKDLPAVTEELTARLARATVTEPPIYHENERLALEAFLDEVRQHGSANHSQEAHRLLRMIKPEPSDAELRAALQAALGTRFRVASHPENGSLWVYDFTTVKQHFYFLRYSPLRAPGGVQACASALLTLAGEEAPR